MNLKGGIVRTVVNQAFPLGSSSFTFDAGFLKEGLYFLRVETTHADRVFLKFIS